MPTINVMSDLHLNFEDLVLPGGDILVLAGDVCEAGHIRLSQNLNKFLDITSRYERFFKEELVKYRKVIYVAGNHEYYQHDYATAHDRIKLLLPDNTHFLQNEFVEIDDVIFYGSTFWTDCNNRDPITAFTLQQQLSDYRFIKHSNSIKVTPLNGANYFTNKFTPQFTIDLHLEALTQLQKVCNTFSDKKIVVVGHHAPSPFSLDPNYADRYHMNGGYCSDLSEVMLNNPNIVLWCHGHVHCCNDYMIGNTRIISNPRGYKGHELRAEEFDASFAVSV
jgi:Icc-related predicted phosphoesterase